MLHRVWLTQQWRPATVAIYSVASSSTLRGLLCLMTWQCETMMAVSFRSATLRVIFWRLLFNHYFIGIVVRRTLNLQLEITLWAKWLGWTYYVLLFCSQFFAGMALVKCRENSLCLCSQVWLETQLGLITSYYQLTKNRILLYCGNFTIIFQWKMTRNLGHAF